MFSRVQNLVEALIEMSLFRSQWNKRLEDILSSSNISDGASNFIRQENIRSHTARAGYIGKAIYIMEGGNPSNPNTESIWLDSCLHLFALRVVDDYFDDYEKAVSFNIKKERLDWEKILNGTRNDKYSSPPEEAAGFFLKKIVEKYGDVPDYINIINKLYSAVCDVEDTALTYQERKTRDLDVAALTVEPTTRLIIPYGVHSSLNVQNSIIHLSKGTRIWDHLGDLDKDYRTGASNFILEHAMIFAEEGESPIEYIRRQSGSEFKKEAAQELDIGEACLTGQPRAYYQTIRTLMTLKYGTEYFVNTRFDTPGYNLLFRKVLG
jgi:hypothetical protein